MSKQKFDVGEKVIVKANKLEGTIKAIKSRNQRKWYSVYIPNKGGIDCFYSYELYKAPETSKFKEGDRVVFTKVATDWLKEYDVNKYVDDYFATYIIDEVNKYSDNIVYRIKKENSNKVIWGLYFFNEDLELYTEKNISKETKDKPIQLVEFREQDIVKEEKLEYLRTQWKALCNTYLEVFCKKHDFPFEYDMWVHDDPGTVVLISDMYVAMDDIRYDIDNDVPETYFRVWYWKSLEVYELCGETYMNYESYCKGAPDYWTEERMQSIRASKKRIEKLKEELEKMIEDTRKGKLF